ncbi:MAG: GntR family transcriptional regulator [Acidiferrobacteraceae bacterium]
MGAYDEVREKGRVRTSLPFEPLYVKVKTQFLERLASGAWAPGALLPSEFELARKYRVSQGTVRKALDELTQQNLLVRRQGKGTFVATHTVDRALFYFFQLVGKGDTREYPESRVLSCREGLAQVKERSCLGLVARARVVRIVRVRSLAGRDCILEHISVPAALFPGLAVRDRTRLPNTLYQYYEQTYGITITRAVERVRAVAAGRRDARYLEVRVGEPLLEIDRLATNLDGRPIEWRVSRCDARDHHYLATLE